jgi:hypothetical protein
MVNGGQFDASAAQNVVIGHTSDGAGGYYPLIWRTGGRAFIQHRVSDSMVQFPIGVDNNALSGNKVELINTGVLDLFAVAVQDAFDHAPDAPLQVVNRQWTISESVPGGSVVTARLSWVTADEGPGVTHAPCSYFNMMHWNGSSWEYFPATVTGSGTINDPYVAEATGITSFSPFGVVSNFPVPVPVLFTEVTAGWDNGAVQIAFVNATELNVKNYEVQRSVDGSHFAGFSNLSPVKNTGSRSSYHCTDAAFISGDNFYRIKATDTKGDIFYSPIVKVGAAGRNTGILIHPFPVTGNTVPILLQHLMAGQYSISISNEMGQMVYTAKITHPGGSADQVLHLPAAIQKGSYILQLSNGMVRINKNLIIQ